MEGLPIAMVLLPITMVVPPIAMVKGPRIAILKYVFQSKYNMGSTHIAWACCKTPEVVKRGTPNAFVGSSTEHNVEAPTNYCQGKGSFARCYDEGGCLSTIAMTRVQSVDRCSPGLIVSSSVCWQRCEEETTVVLSSVSVCCVSALDCRL